MVRIVVIDNNKGSLSALKAGLLNSFGQGAVEILGYSSYDYFLRWFGSGKDTGVDVIVSCNMVILFGMILCIFYSDPDLGPFPENPLLHQVVREEDISSLLVVLRKLFPQLLKV